MKVWIDIFTYFIRLGVTGFGGPLALIAQMHRDCIHKKHWITEDDFRQNFALIKSMPGPVATQMSIYLGYRRGGFWGGLLAGIALNLPAFFLMIFLAMTYERIEGSAVSAAALTGIQMAALALIFHSLKSMTSIYWRRFRFWMMALIGTLLFFVMPVPEIALILLFGLISTAMDGHFSDDGKTMRSWFVPPMALAGMEPALVSALALDSTSVLVTLAWTCFKAGAFVFGTGFAIIPFLQRDFVEVLGWVDITTFKDALAFGQMTPGPVVVTVTFLGYKIAGLMGAVVATVAVYFPSFFHHLTWYPRFSQRLAQMTWVPSFVIGAISAVSAGILWVIGTNLRGLSAFQSVVFVLSLLLVEKSKLPSWFIIIMAGVASAIPTIIGG